MGMVENSFMDKASYINKDSCTDKASCIDIERCQGTASNTCTESNTGTDLGTGTGVSLSTGVGLGTNLGTDTSLGTDPMMKTDSDTPSGVVVGSDPTARALGLLGLLQKRSHWRGADLADSLGVTHRTLRRDIQRLRDLGYKIDGAPGELGGYAMDRGHVLPPLLLDEDETVATTLALTVAASSIDSDYAGPALTALHKIQAGLPHHLGLRLEHLREAVEAMPSRGGASATTILTIIGTIRRQQRLTFTYTDRHENCSRRTVEPHWLFAKHGIWRLITFDLDKNEWRTFRLDRMSRLKSHSWRFAPRETATQLAARAAAPTPTDAYRHRAELVVYASLDHVTDAASDLQHEVSNVSDTHTLITIGGDSANDLAVWLAGFPLPFDLLGDEEVLHAVERLGARLSRAVLNAPSHDAR